MCVTFACIWCVALCHCDMHAVLYLCRLMKCVGESWHWAGCALTTRLTISVTLCCTITSKHSHRELLVSDFITLIMKCTVNEVISLHNWFTFLKNVFEWHCQIWDTSKFNAMGLECSDDDQVSTDLHCTLIGTLSTYAQRCKLGF